MTEEHSGQSEADAPLSRHHYDFAHVVLREACGFNPMAFFQALASPGKGEFLENLWKAASERCVGTGTAWFSSKEIAVESLLLEQYPTILVTMPLPRVATEAFYVAVVLLTPMDQIVAGAVPEHPSFAYYTLELGISPNGSRYTLFSSWEDGSHVCFGNGRGAEPAAFLGAVAERLQGS